jgi:hypothetical protein
MGKSSKKGSFLLKCTVKSEGPGQDSIWTDHNSVNIFFEKIDKLPRGQLSEIYQNSH